MAAPEDGKPAASGETVIEGSVEVVTFERPDTGFRVIKLAVAGRSDRLPVIGVFPPVAVGAVVRVRGRIERDIRHGEQLRAASLTELAPTTLRGIEKYLGSGMIHGVGQKSAERIVATFGLGTLKVLDEEPHRLSEVPGLGSRRAESIAQSWREQRAVRDVMVFLQAHGASASLAARVLKRYGDRAAVIVAAEPYRLALDVWGVGFKTADRIAAAVGIARDSPERMQAGLLQTLRDLTDQGHVYSAESELFSRAATMLELPDAQAGDDALRLALASLGLLGHVVVERVADTPLVFAEAMHTAEGRLARTLIALAGQPGRVLRGAAGAIDEFEARAGVVLAPEQRRAVEEAARSPLVVVTGGPGVGKTTIVRAIIAVFDRAGLAVRLAAPTGRAAKRMGEATGREAFTLHRLLEFDPKRATFKKGAENPLDAAAVVVDEASMLDLSLADALVQALAPETRLVLVGDVDQLPSVGPGAVLRDIIASGRIPCVRLTQIFRQAEASLIVTNAHRINAGETPIAPGPGETEADFFMLARRDPDSARKTILELVEKRIPRRFGFDPIRDVQVLTPMHRGPTGSLALNQALQAALNPAGPSLERGARVFRVGDKVMQLRNDYERSVFNGDLGIVRGIQEDEDQGSCLLVAFDDREVVYPPASLDELVLAYACSVHKAQGSEYPAVVIPLLTTHYVMLSRNLLYTAVTRGKRLVVLVCDPRALALALSADRKDERRTRLAARLRSAEKGLL